MSQFKLSNKQYEILEFIFDQISIIGRPPTIREICDQFGFASPRSASDHLKALEKKGYIHRTKSPRGIQLAYDKVWALFGIPIVSRIDPDSPQLADAQFSGVLTPSDLYPVERDLFAFHMPDDSMIGVGILRDDLLVAREQDDAEPGNIVIALADRGLIVRTVYDDTNGTRMLQAAHPDVSPIPVSDAYLLGVALRLVRNY